MPFGIVSERAGCERGRPLLATALVAVISCGPTTSSETLTTPDEASTGDESTSDTTTGPCSFRERRVDEEDREPECDGLAQEECIRAPACESVTGRLVDTCVATSVECGSQELYLGCAGARVCKNEVGFFCAPDFSTTYVSERRCNPVVGLVLCEPELQDSELEQLADSAFASCIDA